MKKIIKFSIIGIVLIAILLAVIAISRIGGAEIAEGTYKITDYEAYPDAYIVVEENRVQFYNIDLNAIYREYQMDTYLNAKEQGLDIGMSKEELEPLSDLNEMFVENAFELDYEWQADDNKVGTFSYVYFCKGEGNLFGLVLEYNSLHKTLQINSPVQTLVFEK